MMDVTYPLVDPETGEFLANNDEERWALVNELSELLVFAAKASQRVNDLRRMLEFLMRPGEAVGFPDGWAVRVQPGASARRGLNRQALEQHAEALQPLGLAPRDQDPPPRIYPLVSELTSAKSRRDLARMGLTPETFLIQGEPGQPRVIVEAPDA